MDIKHNFKIDAKPEMIYSAIVSPYGLHSWFGGEGTIATKVGESHVLNYMKEGAPKSLELQIEELELNKKVVWKCVNHEFDVWRDTILTFEISDSGELKFTHSNFKKKYKNSKRYVMVVKVWDYFMGNLKDFCETGESHPW